MDSNLFAAPDVEIANRQPLIDGPANPLVIRIMGALAPLVVGLFYGFIVWDALEKEDLPEIVSILGFWLAVGFMTWVAVGGVIAIFDRTRIFADSIESRWFFRRQVEFHEVCYVRQVTSSPPTIYIIKYDGKEVIIQGGNKKLHVAFLELAARFPPPPSQTQHIA